MNKINPLFCRKKQKEDDEKQEKQKLERLTMIAEKVVEVLCEYETLCCEVDPIFRTISQQVNFKMSKFQISEIKNVP